MHHLLGLKGLIWILYAKSNFSLSLSLSFSLARVNGSPGNWTLIIEQIVQQEQYPCLSSDLETVVLKISHILWYRVTRSITKHLMMKNGHENDTFKSILISKHKASTLTVLSLFFLKILDFILRSGWVVLFSEIVKIQTSVRTLKFFFKWVNLAWFWRMVLSIDKFKVSTVWFLD